MMKRVLIFVALLAALLAVTPSSAESICADAGATGLLPGRVVRDGGMKVPTVCVPMP